MSFKRGFGFQGHGMGRERNGGSAFRGALSGLGGFDNRRHGLNLGIA